MAAFLSTTRCRQASEVRPERLVEGRAVTQREGREYASVKIWNRLLLPHEKPWAAERPWRSRPHLWIHFAALAIAMKQRPPLKKIIPKQTTFMIVDSGGENKIKKATKKPVSCETDKPSWPSRVSLAPASAKANGASRLSNHTGNCWRSQGIGYLFQISPSLAVTRI